MKFNTIKDVDKVMLTINKGNDGRRLFTPMFKKALLEYATEHKVSIAMLETATGISVSNLRRWQGQHAEGLFSLSGAYNVSRKSKKLNENLLIRLKQNIARLEGKLKLVEECEALGLVVTG